MAGLTQAEAAQKLGKRGRRSIVAYESGETKPDYCTRVVMQLLAHGSPPTPWPD